MSRQLDNIVTVRFSGEVNERMREVAKQMNLPYTNLVRLAVTRFLALPDEWQPRVDIIYSTTEEQGGEANDVTANQRPPS